MSIDGAAFESSVLACGEDTGCAFNAAATIGDAMCVEGALIPGFEDAVSVLPELEVGVEPGFAEALLFDIGWVAEGAVDAG